MRQMLGENEQRELAEEPEAGGRIGRYVVLDRLGAGAMGTVYLGYDPELDRRVAIKVLRATKARSKRGRDRLLREAQAMAKLSHANVVGVYDVGALGRRVFITMEFVEGGTLYTWLARPRSWREVLRVFIAAGRGLEAAHEAGLVHRDFKPDNVLLTREGEVKVTDFGLVRRERSESDDDDALEFEDGPAGSSARNELLATPLTRAGAVIGTPAYMAPEQFLGVPADARADQFAFCVVLYRALYGVMPFGSEAASIEEIRGRVLGNERVETPRDGKVPAWVGAIVERGLAHERAQRWSSMGELLAALSHDPRRRRRRIAAAVATLGVLGSVALGVGWSEQRAQRACDAEGARSQLAWSPARKQALRETMLALQLEGGEAAWGQAEAAFDEWATSWSSARSDACVAERDTRGSAAVSHCLDLQLVHVEGTLDALEQATRVSLIHAVEISAELPLPGSCAGHSGTGLEAEASDGEARDLRRSLARAEALNIATRHGEALELATVVAERSESVGLEALVAQAQRVAGRAAHAAADYERARELYGEAFHSAARIAEDRVALSACLGLVWLETDRTKFELAAHWARLAETLTARLGNHAADLAELEHRRGRMLQGMGEHAEAELCYRRALAHMLEADGEGHVASVKLRLKLAYVLRMQGKYDEIPELYARARELARGGLGPTHPQLAIIDLEQGKAEHASGRSQQARELLQAAAMGLEQAFEAEHPLLFDTVHSLAMVEYASGHLHEARRGFERAIALGAVTYGADSPRLGQLITNGAVVLQDLGLHAEAEAAYLRGRALIEAGYGPSYDGLGYVDSALGELHMQLGEQAEAEAELQRALAIFTTSLGPEHVMLSEPLRILGAGLCERGELDAGLEQLQRALELAVRSDGPDHPDNVGILFALSRCEVLAGQLQQGLERLAHARAIALPRAAPNSLGRARLDLATGETELLAGRHAEALVHARAAVTLLAGMGEEVIPTLVALDSELLLARASWATGAEEEAELACAQVRELLEVGELDPRIVALRRAKLERWEQQHPALVRG